MFRSSVFAHQNVKLNIFRRKFRLIYRNLTLKFLHTIEKEVHSILKTKIYKLIENI